MPKFTFLRGNLSVKMPLTRPIFSFQGVSARFCELIYKSLAPTFPVGPNDLSGNPANRLSEIWARFNLYSGPNTVTLFSDRLSFDFVNLLRTDYPIILDLMRRVHDEFPSAFPECEYERVDSTSYIHLELLPPADVPTYLQRYQLKEIQKAFADTGKIVVEPGMRHGVAASDEKWQTKFGVDRSLASDKAVFVDVSTTLKQLPKEFSFLEKQQLFQKIGDACLKALGLEPADA
jgi:hypothetical protein